MALLRSNAETYNGPHHAISEAARNIEKVAIDAIASPEFRDNIDEA